jgi:hypothetical protein
MYVKDYLERLDRRILIGRRDSECKASIFDKNSNSGDKNNDGDPRSEKGRKNKG